MKSPSIAYVTQNDLTDRKSWCLHPETGLVGVGYYLLQALSRLPVSISPIGSKLEHRPSIKALTKSAKYRMVGMRYPSYLDPSIFQALGKELSAEISKVENDIDLIFCPDNAFTLAYLESDKPIVLMTDAPWIAILDFYSSLTGFCQETKDFIFKIEKQVFERCALVCVSSQWAQKIVCDTYGLPEKKVPVVPRGPSFGYKVDTNTVLNSISERSQKTCRLVFMGSNWERKRGNFAVEIAKILNGKGLTTEIDMIGKGPDDNLPDFVRVTGFIEKSSDAQEKIVGNLISKAHFMVVPTQADTFGLFTPEANMHGVPVLTCDTGGVSDGVRNGVNGKVFPLSATPEEFADYVLEHFEDYDKYKSFALSSHEEYQSRLNWDLGANTLLNLMNTTI